MSNILSVSKLLFFKIDKYDYTDFHICDFSNTPRPHYCMGLILSGCGVFESQGEAVTVKSGDIIFVPVGSTYISRWRGNPDISYISIHFSFEFPGMTSQGDALGIQKISPDNFKKTKDMYLDMYNSYEKDKPMQFMALSTFYAVMSEVYTKLQFNTSDKNDPRITKAVEYIEYNYNKNLSVKELACMCNMGISNFHALFKSETGYSPLKYKHIAAIRHAELMLLDNPKKSIEEISDETGFESSIYFREIFKKITGLTPRQYRKMKIE